MNRLLAILILGLLAFGSVGLSATGAGAAGAGATPAACASSTGNILDDVDALALPIVQKDGPSAKSRSSQPDGPQYACNSRCARACAQRYGNCPTRQCRQAYRACIRSCGC